MAFNVGRLLVAIFLTLIIAPLIAGPFLFGWSALSKLGVVPPSDRIDESRPMQVVFMTIVTLSTLAAFATAMFLTGLMDF